MTMKKIFFLAGILLSLTNISFAVFAEEKVGTTVKEEQVSDEKAMEWYRENFVIWRACHNELTDKLGENIKRDKAYLNRTIAALGKLSEVLQEEKKAQLQGYISRYRQTTGSLNNLRRNKSLRKRIKLKLDKLERNIEKEFSCQRIEKNELIIVKEASEKMLELEEVTYLPGAPPAGSSKKKYRYVADKNSRTFHRVNCVYVSKIPKDERVYFETKKEAEKSSRHVHRRCR